MAGHLFLSGLLVALAVWTPATRAQATVPGQPAYAWAESCRSCHKPQYDAWAKTKHATALDRLSDGDQQKACVGCHVTGPKTRVTEGGKVLNRGIQCEACHGAAAAHVADPAVRLGLVKVPDETLCAECHSDKGPHFKGFFYGAMRGLSHRTE